ncbi:MAG: Uma2 family endonuclease [Polyangiaceae bacterium]|nr:Uma2 family endonuclease [Polyangiaceae bacterium]
MSPKPPRRGAVRTPPDIVLEVLSSTPRDERRDRVHKMDDYAAFGVGWYWLLDPAARVLELYALDRARGRHVRELGATDGKLTRVPGCDGLELDLDVLWRRIDALPEAPTSEDEG